MKTDPIRMFVGKFRYLSNYYRTDVVFEGKVYRTVEHAFQAAKTLSEKERAKIRSSQDPGSAKRIGRRVTLREDWEDVKVGIMEDLVRQKFSRNFMKYKLLNTGDRELVEGNWWHDVFWGVDERTGEGRNELGKILMKIRDELKEK